MSKKERIEELERKIAELEERIVLLELRPIIPIPVLEPYRIDRVDPLRPPYTITCESSDDTIRIHDTTLIYAHDAA